MFFRESGKTTWAQQGAKIVAKSTEETATGEFGYSVSIAATKGEYALIGAPGDKENVGTAFVFLRTGTAWAQQGAKLVPKSGEETGAGSFGKSVSISGAGEYALIGAPDDNTKIGAAWVFLRTGTTWAQQGAKMVAKSGEETGAGEFGYSVSVAPTKGEYALMGAPSDNSSIGAAWVFLRSGTTWTQQGTKFTGTGESGAGEFGKSVALAGEGNYALMGAPRDSKEIGAAWVFFRETGKTTWSQQGEKLTGKEEFGEGEVLAGRGQFGYSVALSSDGNTALIGGLEYNGATGAAWVFTRTGSTWTQQGPKLTGSGEEGAGEFGASVALSSSGNTALIGGNRDNGGVGAAWVFTRSGSVWTQQGAKLLAKSGEEVGPGEFGTSVALSSEGTLTYALIGAPGEGLGVTARFGAAWVFSRSGTTWTQQGEKLTGRSFGEIEGGPEGGEFGDSVALNSEGSTALIGGPGDNAKVGGAWVFTRSGTIWSHQGGKITGTGETGAGELGATSAALSSSGNTALLGAPSDNKNVGAAFVFTRAGSVWTQQGEKLTGSEEKGEGQFGFSVALSANGFTALMGGPNDNANVGAAWVFTHSGATWTQFGSKLAGTGEAGEGFFGDSVALSSEGNTALIGGSGDNKNVGAGWVFVNTSPTVETKPATSLTQTTATLNATVNPDGGEVTKCEFEYGTTTGYGSKASCSALPGKGTEPVAVSAAITGLTNTTTYHFRILATNASGTSTGSDETSKTLGPPTVVTKPASPVAQTTATLNATVNPNGGEVTKCEFEYGTTTGYGSKASCSSLPGKGAEPVAVSAAITGLTNTTTYHFRILATNASGTSTGSDETFKTLPNPPTVVTKPASPIAATTATLNATVNPNGAEVTNCEFEYGTTTGYGSKASCSSLPGKGTEPVAVSAAITGLSANTTYHFRISATNAGGTSTGSDEPFKTPPPGPTVVTGTASSVTQTSATLNATVNPNGGEVSLCVIEAATAKYYEETKSYEEGEPCSSLPGNGNSPVPVSAQIGGLATEHGLRVQDRRGKPERSQLRLKSDVYDAAQTPDGRDQTGVVDHPDDSHPERHREPQRRGSHQLRIRIRHDDRLRLQSVVLLAAGEREQPHPGVRRDHGPDRQRHLPLQDLGDKLGRHEHRL